MPRSRSVPIMACLASTVCLIVYLACLGHEFLFVDDLNYVCNNPAIKTLDRHLLLAPFTTPFANDYWMPLVWISFALDHALWGLNPFGYHLTSIVLHAINAALVVVLADRVIHAVHRQEGEGATKANNLYPLFLILSALLWALHPLRVEPAAWVSGRKDVLNGIFTISSALFYLQYASLPAGASVGRRWGYYFASLALFTFSLMAKPVSVVLPVVLLIADWYPLARFKSQRLSRLAMEKMPYLLFSLLATLLVSQSKVKTGSLWSVEDFPFHLRAVVSGNAVFEYLKGMLWPLGLLPYNILDNPVPSSFIVKTAIVLVVTVAICCCWQKHRPLVAVWFSFLTLLLPVLAFTYNGGDLAFAARFTYLPAIVPTIAVAMVITETIRRLDGGRRALALVVAVCVLCLYAGITLSMIAVWHDTGSFLTRVIAFEPRGSLYYTRGCHYLQRGEYAAALADFSAAAGMTKDDENALVNLHAFRAETLRLMRKNAAAVDEFSAVIAQNPHPLYYYHRGLALKAMGRRLEAEGDFRRAGSYNGPLLWIGS